MKRLILAAVFGVFLFLISIIHAQILSDREQAFRVVEESGQLFQIRIEPNQDDFLLEVNVLGEPIATIEREPLDVRASYGFGSERTTLNIRPRPGRENEYIIPDTDVRAFQLEISDPESRKSERFDVEVPE